MNILMALYLFATGAACGSFALVLADRMHSGKNWVSGRSACDHCGHNLHVRDLVPLASWLLQRGKCRYCQKRLSVYYPLVELGVASAFAVSYLVFPFTLTGWGIVLFALWLVSLIIMAALVVTDLKWYLLLSKLVYPLIGLAAVHWLIRVAVFEEDSIVVTLLNTGGALLVGAGLFWALHAVSRGRWIGDGDYRLGVAIGLFLGDTLLAWMALFVASTLGLLVAVPSLLKRQNKSQVRIPFGPFLIIGLAVAYLVGSDLLTWYSKHVLISVVTPRLTAVISVKLMLYSVV